MNALQTDRNKAASVQDSKVLLVVDDEFLIRWSLRTRLTAAGFTVVEAPDATSARAAFARGGVDLVLLDVLLPDGSGLDLLKEFVASSPSSRIILISAHGTDDMASRARADGAFAFVHKPFDLEEIVKLAEKAAEPT